MTKFDAKAAAERFKQDLLSGKYPVDEGTLRRFRYNQMTKEERDEYDREFAKREQELWEASQPTEEEWKAFLESDLLQYLKAL